MKFSALKRTETSSSAIHFLFLFVSSAMEFVFGISDIAHLKT